MIIITHTTECLLAPCVRTEPVQNRLQCASGPCAEAIHQVPWTRTLSFTRTTMCIPRPPTGMWGLRKLIWANIRVSVQNSLGPSRSHHLTLKGTLWLTPKGALEAMRHCDRANADLRACVCWGRGCAVWVSCCLSMDASYIGMSRWTCGTIALLPLASMSLTELLNRS